MKIIIKPEVYNKIMYWVDKADFEVSGFGLVKYNNETKDFEVNEAYLLKQEGGAAHTDIDGAALSKLLFESRDKASDGLLKFWWHSHVNMSVFWSSQDTSTIKELGYQGWIVASVFNKKREVKSAVCWQTTSELGTSLSLSDDVKTEIGTPLTQDQITLFDKEFQTKVTKQTFVNSYQNYRDYYDDSSYTHRYTGTPTPAPVSPIEEAAVDIEEYRKELLEIGILGYGAKIEAQAIGLTVGKYLEKLLHGTDQDFDDILKQLRATENNQNKMIMGGGCA